ncbi:MAG: hypothetical protein ABL959_11285 [Pyrinomonadaceae bacterium]
MGVVIDNTGFTFGGKRFVFDLYFLNDNSKVLARTSGETFKNIVCEWAEVLRTITPENSPFFLPYGPDDEWTDCLEASLRNDKIVFNDVRVGREGWTIDFNDLEEFITSQQEVYETRAKLPEVAKDDAISVLMNADVIDK